MVLVEGLLLKSGENILNEFYKSVKDAAKAKWQNFDWHTARKTYFEKIEKEYSTTRILGKSEPIILDDIFTDVYLLDKPTAFQRFDITQLQNRFETLETKKSRIKGLDLIKKQEKCRLYILGKPGAGKTTFLKYIALKASRNEIKKIPIFVSLKEWADSKLPLMQFLVRQFYICDFPEHQPVIEYILINGLAIVLFDGLDETQNENQDRDKIIQEIRDFSRKYVDSQILITCRIAANDYIFEHFTYLEIADFNEDQIEKYTEKWFVDDKIRLDQFRKEFSNIKNVRLREIANTPLLLSLLCLNFEETGEFPQRRVEIYEDGIRGLLTKWDLSRNIKRDEIYKGLSLGRKQQLFARIAAQMFGNNEYFIPKSKLAEGFLPSLKIFKSLSAADNFRVFKQSLVRYSFSFFVLNLVANIKYVSPL